MPTEERSAEALISESDLVEIIKRRIGDGDSLGMDEVGVGDDAAVLRSEPGHLVLTADAMVDGVHFLSNSMSWHDIGWKCTVSNQSDIAAMGALPEFAVLTLALPATTRIVDLQDLLDGVIGALSKFGGQLVGGDTVASETTMVNVALTGRLCRQDRPLTRKSALPGQQVAVTGPLGGSAGGLAILQTRISAENRLENREDEAKLLEAHFRPEPRVDVVQTLVDAGIECAMDISDGLLIDLERICVASGVDAVIHADRVPMAPNLKTSFPDKAREFALTGGEDYELLYVGDADAVSSVKAKRNCDADGFGVIGEIIAPRGTGGEVTVLDEAGLKVEFDGKGWDHFAGSSGAN